jgi:hypothetical protein
MLKNVMLLGVFLVMLACVCTASDEIATNPINVSKIVEANKTVNVSKIVEANKTVNVSKIVGANKTVNVSKIVGANHTITTAPVEANNSKEIASETATVQSGLATQFWVELVPWPQGNPKRLWLNVGGKWRHLDNPTDGILASVQAAFCNCPDVLQAMVWYHDTVIVGLVVKQK